MRTHPYTLPEVTAMHEAAVARRSPEQLAADGADLGAIAAAAVAAAPEQPEANRELVVGPELAPIVEHLRDSFAVSHQAYEQLADALGIAPEVVEDVYDSFEKQLAQWFKTGSLDYIREQLEQDPQLSFSLVAVPDRVVEKDKLYQAAHSFAKGQDDCNGASIYNSLYDHYSDKELSGTPASETNGTSSQAVRFILIPSQSTNALGNTSVTSQRESLRVFKAAQTDAHPGINLKIPSILDGIAWWYTLREQQREDESAPDKQLNVSDYTETYLRHIDLPEKSPGGVAFVPYSRVSDGAFVPYSCVSDGGKPVLNSSGVGDGHSMRVAIG